MPISGIICEKLGWPSMFYIFGSVSCTWVILWFIIAQNSPAEYKSIDQRELEYITAELPTSKDNKKSVPWKNIFCSIPFWSIAITHLCQGSTNIFSSPSGRHLTQNRNFRIKIDMVLNRIVEGSSIFSENQNLNLF